MQSHCYHTNADYFTKVWRVEMDLIQYNDRNAVSLFLGFKEGLYSRLTSS